MRISFATTAHIAGTPENILDEMSNSLSITAEAESLVIVDVEVVKTAISEYESSKENISSELAEFLKDAMQEITKDKDIISDNIGEIFFVS